MNPRNRGYVHFLSSQRIREKNQHAKAANSCWSMAVELTTKLSRAQLPSSKHAVRAAHPFVRRPLSVFGRAYVAGSIPCRINHGSVISRLQWDKPPSSLNYDPILITVTEGLLETEHPYAFVARTAFENLLQAQGAAAKAVPLLTRLVPPLRAALSSSDKKVFGVGLKAVRQLSEAVGAALNHYLDVLLIIKINKRLFDKQLGVEVQNTLETFEKAGPQAYAIIKSKVPAYSSVFNNGSPRSSRSSLRTSSSGTVRSTSSSSRL